MFPLGPSNTTAWAPIDNRRSLVNCKSPRGSVIASSWSELPAETYGCRVIVCDLQNPEHERCLLTVDETHVVSKPPPRSSSENPTPIGSAPQKVSDAWPIACDVSVLSSGDERQDRDQTPARAVSDNSPGLRPVALSGRSPPLGLICRSASRSILRTDRRRPQPGQSVQKQDLRAP